MKKNIDLIIDGIAPEKVMYDTDNHSLVVLYPAQKEFKRGDVLKSKGSDAIFILDAISPKPEDEEWCSSIIGLNFQGILVQRDTYCWGSIHDARLATPEEQQILFDALKKEGKKWNAETLQVEDIKKEFKRGDILASDDTLLLIFDKYETINQENDAFYSIWHNIRTIYHRNWMTKSFKHATNEQIARLHEDLRKDGKRWNSETLQVEDLDISDIVVDLVSACEYLEIKRPSNFILDEACERSEKFEAQITLQLIREAWNKFDGFVIDWSDDEQSKYHPVLNFDGYIKYYTQRSTRDIASSSYSFSTSRRALQFGNQFKELFKIALGL